MILKDNEEWQSSRPPRSIACCRGVHSLLKIRTMARDRGPAALSDEVAANQATVTSDKDKLSTDEADSALTSQIDSDEAAVTSAESQLATAVADLSDAALKATFSGTVAAAPVDLYVFEDALLVIAGGQAKRIAFSFVADVRARDYTVTVEVTGNDALAVSRLGRRTGEFAALSTEERKRVTEVVVAAAGDVPVVAHTGALTTAETVELVPMGSGEATLRRMTFAVAP